VFSIGDEAVCARIERKASHLAKPAAAAVASRAVTVSAQPMGMRADPSFFIRLVEGRERRP
jgi:hypothetical protein